MGKTSLARAVIHHAQITSQYNQYRHFVACDSAANKVQLAALIGAHLGLKPGKDLTRTVVRHLSNGPPSLLILDSLETVWEPAESRDGIEEFLSHLTDSNHLALIITMWGAERPMKVCWSRPFLVPLGPLSQEAAQKTFTDIADDTNEPIEVDKILSLTDNMPLAINLLAHLADLEGCTSVLSCWEGERTSLISDGLKDLPQTKDLLSLLSMLSDAELVQSKLPLDNILGCKAALIRTSLAYSDEHKRLKGLALIREHIQKIQPPGDHLVRPLLKCVQEQLQFCTEYYGTLSGSSTVGRILSNFANIQSILCNGLHHGHPDLKESIYCTCTRGRIK
ncbi:hypothetical protein B0H19DRAFT_1064298 [Mycena capillaripes]|nr:hypothetical protein B0H19DRAFT_1064298 [Mycena capillaripes]